MAIQKPSTEKPFITKADNNIINAFITKVKSPRVKILIGKVIIINKGLIVMFTNPKNNASQRAAQIPAILTPGTIQAVKTIAMAIVSHFKNIFILKFNNIKLIKTLYLFLFL